MTIFIVVIAVLALLVIQGIVLSSVFNRKNHAGSDSTGLSLLQQQLVNLPAL